jgi:hypothetical protein
VEAWVIGGVALVLSLRLVPLWVRGTREGGRAILSPDATESDRQAALCGIAHRLPTEVCTQSWGARARGVRGAAHAAGTAPIARAATVMDTNTSRATGDAHTRPLALLAPPGATNPRLAASIRCSSPTHAQGLGHTPPPRAHRAVHAVPVVPRGEGASHESI